MKQTTIKIADRIFLTKIEDEKFKLSKFSINIITPLKEETATENALISYLMKNGCTKYPNQTALNRYLGLLYGAVLESDVRKNGDNQIISLMAGAISDSYCIDNEPVASKLAQLLCDVLLNPPAFTEENVNLEKEMLKDAILSNINDKRSYAIDKAVKIACENEPFGICSLGQIEKLDKITPETLLKSRENLLKTSAIEIVLCGNHFDEEITQIFKKAFSTVSREGDFVPKTLHSPSSQLKNENEKMDVTQTKLVIVLKSKTDVSNEDSTALSVMNTLYGGGAYSKLFTNVREKMSLCYYCASISDRLKGIIVADCGTQHTDLEKAKNAIIKEFENIKNGIFTDEELSNTKKSLVTSCKAVTDSVNGVMSWHLSNKMTGKNTTPQEEIAAIENVTREDVVKMSNNFEVNVIYSLTGGGEDD